MKPLVYRLFALVAAFVLFTAHRSFGQQYTIYGDLIKGDSIYAGKKFLVQDTGSLDPLLKPNILHTHFIRTIISLQIDESSYLTLPDSVSATIKIKVNYRDTLHTPGSINDRILHVNYYRDGKYQARDLFWLQGADSVEVEVLNVSGSPGVATSFMPALQLKTQLVLDRDFVLNPVSGETMNCTANGITALTTSTSRLSSDGELLVSWGSIVGCREYEVEWTFADQSAIDAGRYNIAGQLNADLLFRNNATRVTVNADTCLIPLLYEGPGRIFYRVRGIQTGDDGELIHTVWSSHFGGSGLGQYAFDGHAQNLNWQAVTDFAENNKRKTVVQYYDGALNSRQTVTRNNSTRKAIVAETFYDQQGAPAIQVLPAPSLNNLLQYHSGFNVAHGNAAYNVDFYDPTGDGLPDCDRGADTMSSMSGASQYYSPLNPQKNQGMHQYIPDARGFVFSETRYTPDNSGRLARQSGVGEVFRMGGGKETRFYYATPEQNDLDALFGTEAGDASHYQKHMVRDANGQYSVSYMDMDGRTVATALAGNAPANLQQLPSYRDSVQTDSLLTKANNTIRDDRSVSTKTILMPRADTLLFHYSMQPASVSLADCANRNICYQCKYDLVISISDDCNNVQFGGTPKLITLSNFNLYEIDTSCAVAVPIDTSFSQYLAEGAYTITKELRVSEAAMNLLRDSVYMQYNLCRAYDSLFQEELTRIKGGVECEQAQQGLDENAFYRDQMISDMFPITGQYGQWPVPETGLSIFGQFEESLIQYYQQPPAPYTNELGLPDTVLNAAGIASLPSQLSREDFIAQFKPSWALSLLPFHPEYGILQQYEQLGSSQHYNAAFRAVETYAEAVTKGYLNPTHNLSQLPASRFTLGTADSLLQHLHTVSPSDETTARNYLEDKLFHYKDISGLGTPGYLSLWGLATIAVKCTGDANLSCIMRWNNPAAAMNPDSLCEEELDLAWVIFREQYLSIKDNWVNNYVRSHATPSPYSEAVLDPVFPNTSNPLAGSGLSGDPEDFSADSTAARGMVAAVYLNNCTQYTTQWWKQLQSGCNTYTSADSSIILRYLVEVCVNGSDDNHPAGSSSVAPAKMAGSRFKSFEEVIRFYNDSTGRPTDQYCNSYLITQPRPYNNPTIVADLPVVTKPRDCECEKINLYYHHFQDQGGAYPDFSSYLYVRFHVQVREADLTKLRSLCAANAACIATGRPVKLPVLFQCEVSGACIPCSIIEDYKNEFSSQFPGVEPAEIEADTAQQRKNRLFASYLNQKLGFSSTAYDYLQFLDSCQHAPASPVSIVTIDDANARWWRQLITDFKFDYNAKSDYYVNHGWGGDSYWGGSNYRVEGIDPFTYMYTYDEFSDSAIISDGKLHMSHRDKAGQEGSISYSSQRAIAVDNTFSYEVRLRNPGGGNLEFSALMNEHGAGTPEYYTAVFVPGADSGYYLYRGDTTRSVFLGNADLSGWHTVKFSLTPYSYRVYLDGTMVSLEGRDAARTVDGLFGFDIRGTNVTNLEIDWFKLYGKDENLVLHEDFSKHWNVQRPDPGLLLPQPNCKTALAEFYNSRFKFSYYDYTIEQIDSMYFAATGERADYCDECVLNENAARHLSFYNGLDSAVLASANQIITTLDGGSIVECYLQTDDPEEGYATLLRLDDRGKPVWHFNAALYTIGAVNQTRDGGFLVTSFDAEGTRSFMKISPGGNIAWSKEGSNFPVSNLHPARDGKIYTAERFFPIYPDRRLAIVVGKLKNDASASTTKRYFLPNNYDNSHYALVVSNLVSTNDSLYCIGFLVKVGIPIKMSTFCLPISLNSGESGKFTFFSKPNSQLSLMKSDASRNTVRLAVSEADSLFHHTAYNFIEINGLNGSISTSKIEDGSTALITSIDDTSALITIYDSTNALIVVKKSENATYSKRFDLSNKRIDSLSENSWPAEAGAFNPNYSLNVTANLASGNYILSGGRAGDMVTVRLDSGLNGSCYGRDTTIEITSSAIDTFMLTSVMDTTITTTVSDHSESQENLLFPMSFFKSCENGSCSIASGPVMCGKSLPVPDSLLADYSLCADTAAMAGAAATYLLSRMRDSLLGNFNQRYQAACISSANGESLAVTRKVNEYHYTLYYYDLAGNLVKTIPPEGVRPNRDSAWLASVKTKRRSGEFLAPEHGLITLYRYNSLNQVVSQYSPDGGLSGFWYDRLGRLSVSQNALQAQIRKYSYTKYDAIGRIVEAGQKFQSDTISQPVTQQPGLLADWLSVPYLNAFNEEVIAESVTATAYDTADDVALLALPIPLEQRWYTLRNRVSHTRTYDWLFNDQGTGLYADYTSGSTFDYDIHGNVRNLLHHYRKGLLAAHGDNRFKLIRYDYDLVSGKVNRVSFQPGQKDQFYHRYEYDAENRLTDVYTTDRQALVNIPSLEEHEAHYQYYDHGPLARTLTGQRQVQGTDYIYTLQGWLKGVNGIAPDSTHDAGQDGRAGLPVARDAFGFNLNYYLADYHAINTARQPFGDTAGQSVIFPYGLYNGNISSMAVNITRLNQPQLYRYRYDQLHRLTAMQVFRGFHAATPSWGALTATDDYREHIQYDANGNILAYDRNGRTAENQSRQMDSLRYHYTYQNGMLLHNRLGSISDAVPAVNYPEDIDLQGAANYTYDAIGNLIADTAAAIRRITWTVYGKTDSIIKTAVDPGEVENIHYTYDPAGYRISKTVRFKDRPADHTWYVRDATGNVMAVYNYRGQDDTGDTLWLAEQHLYGSARLGISSHRLDMDHASPAAPTADLVGPLYSSNLTRGSKFFEFTNHLGNVLVTLSDKKGSLPATGSLPAYQPDVVSAQDYYPFGMLMPGRTFGTGVNAEGGVMGETANVNGYTLPVDLTLVSRSAGAPDAYAATSSIEFTGSFESLPADEFDAYIADSTYAGGANGTVSNLAGSGGYRYGFNGKENDNEVKGVGNQIDFGARAYDPRIGRWFSTDPDAHKYPGYSPYSFVLNTPMSAVDPDGKLVIFIGGLRLWIGQGDQYDRAKKSANAFQGIYHYDIYKYWSTDKNAFGKKVDMAESFANRIGDHNTWFTSGSSNWQSQPGQRIDEGKSKAKIFNAMVGMGIIKLETNETIKIVSHSQGGAASLGFAEQLLSYKDTEGNAKYKIETMYFITPHQPDKFSFNIPGVRGVQYSHPNDAVSSAAPWWLTNGSSKFQKVVGMTEFVGRDIMGGPGQPPAEGPNGNRGGHNVTDNDYIFSINPGLPGYVAPRKDQIKPMSQGSNK